MFDCGIIISIIVGVFTSLIVWYLTNYMMSPTFVVKEDVRFDAIEKEFFIVVQNNSNLFNAYNVMMYCIHYEGNIIKEPQNVRPTKTVAQERQVFRTKETAKVSIHKLLTDLPENRNDVKSLEVFIIGQNRLGVKNVSVGRIIIPFKGKKIEHYRNDDNY